MPVEKTDVIDLAAHNPTTGELMLVMVETRDWNTAPEAVQQLDAKLATYAELVLSGDIARQHPEYLKCPVLIRLDHFSPINEIVPVVLRQWAGKLAGVPVSICSHRMYWNPVVRFFKGLAARFSGPHQGVVRWDPGSGSTALLTAAQFTEQFVAALRRVRPEYQIQMLGELELNLVAPDGHDSRGFVDNAYNAYRVTPENKADIIQKYVAAFFETAGLQGKPIDKDRIVPVLKDKAWIQEVNQGVKGSAGGKAFEALHEAYNDDLIIVYAEDSPSNIRYLTPADLVALGLEMSDLFKLACDNLQQILPDPAIRLEDGSYRIRAGGDYDASLLLVDAFWETANLQVTGETVAAVPARDFLGATGSGDEAGMRKIREAAQIVSSRAPYRLTPKLFVRRDGRFVPFDG